MPILATYWPFQQVGTRLLCILIQHLSQADNDFVVAAVKIARLTTPQVEYSVEFWFGLNKTNILLIRRMMDKLRRALSGNDGEDEERGFVAQVKSNTLNLLEKNVVQQLSTLILPI